MLYGPRRFVRSGGRKQRYRGDSYGRDQGGFEEIVAAERCGSYLRRDYMSRSDNSTKNDFQDTVLKKMTRQSWYDDRRGGPNTAQPEVPVRDTALTSLRRNGQPRNTGINDNVIWVWCSLEPWEHPCRRLVFILSDWLGEALRMCHPHPLAHLYIARYISKMGSS